jgi:phosphoglucosamine mutase
VAGRLFGTDGVRGVANVDLTAEQALGIAASAVRILHTDSRVPSPNGTEAARPTVIVGRDTRPSGEFLEAAVVAGLASAGADVVRLGVVPTPAVAHAVAASGAALGVMLSASHNPMPDNGIKLFGAGGFKLPDEVEDAIEADLAEVGLRPRPTGPGVGRVSDDAAYTSGGVGASRGRRASDSTALVDAYVEHLLSTLPVRLDGLHVVVDCAEGSASELAPRVLRAAGAEVTALFADGDGLRINEGCGATHMEALQAAVVEHRADVGIAHDGDADRCLAVDADGQLVDGDQILALLAVALRDRGRLPDDTVVATVMSNLGFRHAMRDAGIAVQETPVGDRYVLEAMRAGGWTLGGEQSGHVVFLDAATTGDGLLTALSVLGQMAATNRPLAELAGVMTRLPQVLLNVRTDRSAAQAPSVLDAVAAAEKELGDNGRVLLRPSGTEPLVRVMVEAADADVARQVAERLAEVVGSAVPAAG